MPASPAPKSTLADLLSFHPLAPLFGLFALASILGNKSPATAGQFATLALGLTWGAHALVVLRWQKHVRDRRLLLAAFLLACAGTAAAVWALACAIGMFREYGATLGLDTTAIDKMQNPKGRAFGMLLQFFPLLACAVSALSAWVGVGTARDARTVLRALDRVTTEQSRAA